jgi:hypothetical protein
MKRFIAIALCNACLFSIPAGAQTPTTSRDYSDLWWNQGESGWGANVVHQGNILFITMFLYGTDGKPTWYLSSAVQYIGTNSAGDDTYRGELAQVTGTPFNVQPFNPNATTATVVGAITFTGLASGGATISYNVNGVPNGTVSKSVTRLTYKANTVTNAQYVGTTSYTRSGCTNPADNGHFNDSADYTITVTDSTLKIVESNGPGKVCNWNGNYTQAGRMGASTGTTVCEDNVPVTYTFSELQITPQSFGTKVVAQEQAGSRCSAVGVLGGTRK